MARPDIELSLVDRRHDSELLEIALTLLDALAMTAHGVIVAESLSPKSVVNIVDKLLNKSRAPAPAMGQRGVLKQRAVNNSLVPAAGFSALCRSN